jgi:tetratricopeptide (TPR) repeat protein
VPLTPPPTAASDDGAVTILFLGANPAGTTPLDIEGEVKAIQDHLPASSPVRFRFVPVVAVRLAELETALLVNRPAIVHFSGHGTRRPIAPAPSPGAPRDLLSEAPAERPTVESAIIVADEAGQPAPIPPAALADLFRVLGPDVRCVVLNACHSALQADALRQHVDCVVGMSDAILDASAIDFSFAFYQALAFGKDVGVAFEAATVQVHLDGQPDFAVPRIATRDGVDAGSIVFTAPVAAVVKEELPAPRPTALPAVPDTYQPRPEETRLREELARLPLVRVQARLGAGKTTLVSQVLRQLAAAPGARRVGYVALPDTLRPEALLEGLTALGDRPGEIARAVAGTPGSAADRIARVLPRLGAGATDAVLFLDLLEKAIDPRTGALERAMHDALWACASGGGAVRVVAAAERDPDDLERDLPADRGALLLLGDLDEAALVTLLRRLLSERRPEVLGEPGAEALLQRAAGLCGGLPRAAVMFADCLSQRRDASLARLLDETPTAVPAEILRYLVQTAYESSSREQQRVLQALAVFACPVPPEAVDALLAPDGAAAASQEALAALSLRGLVSFSAGAYALSALDQAYVVTTLPAPAADDGDGFTLRGLLRRAAAWFKDQIPAALPRPAPATVSAWLHRYRLVLAADDLDDAAAILVQLAPYLAGAGHYDDAIRLGEGRMARPISFPEWEARIAMATGFAHFAVGDALAATAAYQRAAARVQAGAQLDEASRWTIVKSLGGCQLLQGDVEGALQRFTRELAGAARPAVRRDCLAQLAYAHVLRGEADRALACCDEALDVAVDTAGDERTRSTLFHTRAEAGLLARKDDGALRDALRGGILATRSGDPKAVSENQGALAAAWLFAGKLPAARAAAEAALGDPGKAAPGGVVDWDRQRYFPELDHHARALLGLVLLRQGDAGAAALALRGAERAAQRLLARSGADPHPLATSILARLAATVCADRGVTGLDVDTDPARLGADLGRLGAAAPGLAARLDRLLDEVQKAAPTGDFASLRALLLAVAG